MPDSILWMITDEFQPACPQRANVGISSHRDNAAITYAIAFESSPPCLTIRVCKCLYVHAGTEIE